MEPELHDTTLYSFVVTPDPETPLTAQELVSMLRDDQQIAVALDNE